MNEDVLGVTTVDDELFVLLQRADNQVPVYSINDYQHTASSQCAWIRASVAQ